MNLPSMNINKQEFYWCKRVSNGLYTAPVYLTANIMPTNSDGDIVMYGEKYPEYLRVKGFITDEITQILEKDRIYFRKDIPDVHDITQTTNTSANFEVASRPIISKSTVEILLKRIENR
jgi:hypothetical protein